MGLLELFITACMPVLNTLLVTGFGSFLATDFAGILGKEARKHLNYVVFYVFNPCLVSINLAKTITMESMAKLWFMPVNVFFTFIFGLIFGLRGDVSVPRAVIAGVVAVRYVLLPLMGTVLVKVAIRLGVIQPDPLYQFILLLQYAVPPAMNIGTITQLFGVGESECSVIFVWVYAVASVAVTVWSTFFMWTLS
ncbi:hypothetical protein ACQ4PT_039835 [Festuca glaucescens]